MDWRRLAESIGSDLRYTGRGLRNAPGYAVTAVLTLALGLGAVTAMLAVVDSVLLRPVALPHPEQLVVLQHLQGGKPDNAFSSFKQMDTFAADVPAFAGLVQYGVLPKAVTTADGTAMGLEVESSPNIFSLAGAHARLGRLYDARTADSGVAVVSDAFWRETLHGDPHALGRSLTVNGRIVQVIGVLPASFSFPQGNEPLVYVPLQLDAQGNDASGFDGSDALIRLRSGMTMAMAKQQLQAVYGRAYRQDADRGQSVTLRSYRSTIVGAEQPALLALLGACLLLLLIACANAANLQIARATARGMEMSLRAALGAGRGRLLQQIVTESVTVSLLGAAGGLALAAAILAWVHAEYGGAYPRFDTIALSPVVFASCVLLAVLTGVAAALAPAVAAMRSARNTRPSQGGRSVSRSRLSGMLVVTEIALTCVLLMGAGLMLRTFRALEQVPLGFNPHGLTSVVLTPDTLGQSGIALKTTYGRVLDGLAGIPGVQSAANQTSLPFSSYQFTLNSSFRVPGQVLPPRAQVGVSLVSAGYAQTMRTPILKGRSFAATDTEGMPGVCVINQAFVRTFLRGATALGKEVVFTNSDPNDKSPPFMPAPMTIVGVAADEVDGSAISDMRPMVLVNYRQYPGDSQMAAMLLGFTAQFVVRSALPEATLERSIRAVLKRDAPGMAEMSMGRVDDAMQKSFYERRLALRLASGFGVFALLLAAVGIYGVLAYSVTQRRREIGIRMALGSTRAGAVRLVARQAAWMVFAGLVVGLAGAWPAGQAVRSFLFGVKPLDAVSFVAATPVLLAVCVAAAVVPAWRAAQVDPVEALRAE